MKIGVETNTVSIMDPKRKKILSRSLIKKHSAEEFTKIVDALVSDLSENNEQMEYVKNAQITEKNENVEKKDLGFLTTDLLSRINGYANALYVNKSNTIDWEKIKLDGDEWAKMEELKWQQTNVKALKKLKENFNVKEVSLPIIPVENVEHLEEYTNKENYPVNSYDILCEVRMWYKKTKTEKKNTNKKNDNDKETKYFRKSVNQLAETIFRNNFPDADKKDNCSQQTRMKILELYREYIFRESVARLSLDFDYEIYRGGINIPAYLIQCKHGSLHKMQYIPVGEDNEINKYLDIYKNVKKHVENYTQKIEQKIETGTNDNSFTFKITITIELPKEFNKKYFDEKFIYCLLTRSNIFNNGNVFNKNNTEYGDINFKSDGLNCK